MGYEIEDEYKKHPVSRNQRYFDLREEGLTHKQIIKRLKKEGY
jgi:hypothetical protein